MRPCRWPLLALPFLITCADVRLEFPDEEVEEVEVDNLLAVTGDFCTSPAADVAYPVKIMFIVDGSGSQQFSDQNRQRVVAVEETINALIGQPNIYFKVIVFNASVTATPSTDDTDVYTNDMTMLVEALNTLAEADTLTDYQGALSIAYAEMKRDMDAIFLDTIRGQAELGRTKYVNILISDGLPDPQCMAGLCNDLDPLFGIEIDACPGVLVKGMCESQDFLNCLLRADGYEDLGGGICEYNDTQCWCQEDSDNLFGGAADTELAGGNDYNQPYQILQRVADIMELAETYEIGDLRVHAGLVLDPLVDPAVIEVFGDPAQAIPMMQQVAEIGQGQYLEFYGGDSINFVTINFDTIKQHRVIRGFYADNTAARLDPAAPDTDTDGDGLTDSEEFELNSDSLDPDTDGDGYNDLLEYQLRGYAFDFADPCQPPIFDGTGAYTTTCGVEPGACDDDSAPCTENIDCNPGAACVLGTCAVDDDCPNAPHDRCFMGGCWSLNNCQRTADGTAYRDWDKDGLFDCEERQLGTDERSPDSDSDGVPDKLEHVLGLDPLRWDFDSDTDQDSLPNGTEVEWHLSPLHEQSSMSLRERYRYDRDLSGYAVDGRPCYDFTIRKIKLTPTGEAVTVDGMGVGYNRVMVYITENMADALGSTPVYRVGCVWARWVPPTLKLPFDGELNLVETDFSYFQAIDPVFLDPDISARIYDEDRDCLMACTDNSDCGCSTEACWKGICRPADCCDDTDCGNPDYSCVEGSCRVGCQVGTAPDLIECPGGTECRDEYCWATCSTDVDCAASQTCEDGVCHVFPG